MKVVKEYVAIAALIAGSAVGGVALQNAGASAAPGCPADQYILVGGNADPTSSHVPFTPPAGAGVTRVHYPASIAPAGNVAGDASVREGTAALNAAIAQTRRDCPGTKIHTVGYSLGATVAHNVCDTDQSIQCTMIGDPRKPGTGISGNIPDFIPGFHTGGNAEDHTNITQVCGSEDFICRSGSLFSDPIGFINKGIGYAFQGQFGIPDGHTSYAPTGPVDHDVTPEQPSPVPGADQVPPLLPVNIEVHDALKPITDAIVPNVPITQTYQPHTVAEYTPPILKPVVDALPPEIKNWTPPPVQLPALPHIPGIN